MYQLTTSFLIFVCIRVSNSCVATIDPEPATTTTIPSQFTTSTLPNSATTTTVAPITTSTSTTTSTTTTPTTTTTTTTSLAACTCPPLNNPNLNGIICALIPGGLWDATRAVVAKFKQVPNIPDCVMNIDCALSFIEYQLPIIGAQCGLGPPLNLFAKFSCDAADGKWRIAPDFLGLPLGPGIVVNKVACII